MSRFDPSKDRTELIAQVDLINVLIDLYFPQLKPNFESFKNKNQRLITNQQGPFKNPEELKEAYLDLIKEGESLKAAIASLMRELEKFPQ